MSHTVTEKEKSLTNMVTVTKKNTESTLIISVPPKPAQKKKHKRKLVLAVQKGPVAIAHPNQTDIMAEIPQSPTPTKDVIPSSPPVIPSIDPPAANDSSADPAHKEFMVMTEIRAAIKAGKARVQSSRSIKSKGEISLGETEKTD